MSAPSLRTTAQQHPSSSPLLPAIAAIVTLVLWASAFVGIRAIGTSYSPGELTFGRLAVGALALTAVALPQLRRLPPHWLNRCTGWRLLACGILWFAGYNLALNAAERILDAGTSALLIDVGPILVAVLAGVIFKEGFPRWLILGSLIAVVGVVVISFGSKPGTIDIWGVVLALVAALCAAFSILIQKPMLRTVPAAVATWISCGIGAICTLPWLPDLIHKVGHAPLPATLGVVYLGLFPTAIAFTAWAFALSHFPAGRLAITNLAVPALTILLSWILLREVPGPFGWIGGVLALIGVGVTQVRSKRPTPAAEPSAPVSATPVGAPQRIRDAKSFSFTLP